jgi:penicillin-binding protein 1C
MLQDYGVERFQSFLAEMGMTTLHRPSGAYGLSLVLGGAETSLWDLAGIYSGMSRTLNNFYSQSGKYNTQDFHAPLLVAKESPENAVLSDETRLSASAIWLTYQALEEVNRPAIQDNWDKFSAPKRLAWKTGTSFGFRDAWAIGTNPDYVVAAWAGNADGEGRPGLTGITAAAPLMFELLGLLPPSQSWFEQPWDEMIRVPVCHHSGYRFGPDCELADSIWIPEAGLRSEPCPYHRIVHLDNEKRFQVTEQCYPVDDMVHRPWFVLPPAMAWYYKARHPWYQELPQYLEGCNELNSEKIMAFIYPDWDARIFVPVELDGKPGEAVFEIAHRNPDINIYWHLDETYLGSTFHRHQLGIRPAKGEHIVTAVDENGERVVVRFVVEND